MMNYYNPYYSFPSNPRFSFGGPSRIGLLGNLFGRLKAIRWSSILDNTGRILNLANQAIPVVKQITPMMRNAKTMFQVMNEFKKMEPKDTSFKNNQATPFEKQNSPSPEKNNWPTFFM